ncbi:MAG: hypothetical protein KDB80_11715 [Planctomycetes bacterium]|nr:hypothetical protein [Planctomycetota bacterium]
MRRLPLLLLVPALTAPVAAQCLDADTGSVISTADDDIVNINLGHSFTMPDGSSVTSLDVDTNGRVTHVGASGGTNWTENNTQFLGAAHIAPLWTDISPNLGTGLFFYTDANKSVLTWLDVQYYGGSATFTVQLIMRADNTFTIIHDQRVPTDSAIVGSSNGSGAGGQTDLSTLIGGSTNFGTNTVWEDLAVTDLADTKLDYTAGYTVAGTDCMSPPLPTPDVPAEGDTNLPAATPSSLAFVTGLDIEGNFTGSSLQIDADISRTAFSMTTTACNPGSVIGTWLPAPNINHPFICQNYTRLADKLSTTGETVQRLEQVCDWAWLKHSFGSTNSDGCGGGCVPAGFNELGLNCSDTYGASLNASRNNSGPPWEINPFMGDWGPAGSHWDRGFPDPMNGSSIDSAQNAVVAPDNVVFRSAIIDNTDLGTSGATYFGMCYYIHRWEPEENRDNNMSHRTVDLDPGSGTYGVATNDLAYGSVLNRWPGARVESAANLDGSSVARDGRFYVASSVTALNDGWYRYEYAVHNRDNHGRNGQFRVPIADTASVRDMGTHRVRVDDSGAAADWTSNHDTVNDEVVFTAPGVAMGDPIVARYAQPWNTVFNFWFETNAAPEDGSVEIMQAVPQVNAAGSVLVAADVPTCLPLIENIAAGCGVITMNVTGQLNYTDLTFSITGIDPSSLAAGILIGVDLTATQFDLGTAGFGPNGCYFSTPLIASLGAGIVGSTASLSLMTSGANLPDLIVQGAVLRVGGPVVDSADVSDIFLIRCQN